MGYWHCPRFKRNTLSYWKYYTLHILPQNTNLESIDWVFNGISFEVKCSEVTQSCPTLCNPMDCNVQDSSVHGIFQARVLEWVAISFSRGSSRPRDRTWVSRIAGRCFTIWATRPPGNGLGPFIKLLLKCFITESSLLIWKQSLNLITTVGDGGHLANKPQSGE